MQFKRLLVTGEDRLLMRSGFILDIQLLHTLVKVKGRSLQSDRLFCFLLRRVLYARNVSHANQGQNNLDFSRVAATFCGRRDIIMPPLRGSGIFDCV
jgi:hypothetical protein